MQGLAEVWHGRIVLDPSGRMRNDRGSVAVASSTAAPGVFVWVPEVMIDTGRVQVAPARHRIGDPDTAVAAANAQADRLTDGQWLVLDSLVHAGPAGLTDHEHEARNGLLQDSAGKRRYELAALGLAERTGTSRPTPRGKTARVYRATARGVQVWQIERPRRAA